MASRARAQLHTQGGGKGAAPRIAAAAGGDDSLDRLRRRVADEKARHAETARAMRPPDFDARMAREPKANYERIALGHKVARTQNTNYNLGEERDFDLVYGTAHEGMDTASQMHSSSLVPNQHDPTVQQRKKRDNQTFIRGQFAEKREKDSARAFVKSARESTSIAWSADKKGAKAFYGEFTACCDLSEQKHMDLRPFSDNNLHPDSWH